MCQELEIPHFDDAGDAQPLSGLLAEAENPVACLVLAHGAGAGMRHHFMAGLSRGLVDCGISTLRFEFPYMTAGRKRPDVPRRLVRAVRAAAVFAASRFEGDLPLFAGGKSLGGRMTSTAEAEQPLGVSGLVFFGFPLHAPGREGTDRAQHVFGTNVPLLFLQGTRDRLAKIELVRDVCTRLARVDEASPRRSVELREFDDADHGFHVPKRSGKTDAEVIVELATNASSWMRGVSPRH